MHVTFYLILILKTYQDIQPWLVLLASVRITKTKAATKPLELHLPATKAEALYDFTPILLFLLFQKEKNKMKHTSVLSTLPFQKWNLLAC